MKSTVPVIVYSKPGEPLRADVNAIPDWGGFEKLSIYLQRLQGATLIEATDGPDSRRWVFNIDGQRIELWHDDFYGNTVVAMSVEGNRVIKNIAEDLYRRLQNA